MLLWLLCHQSRVESEKPAECWLEKWSRIAQEQGFRALNKLRDGVEQAINILGGGFVAHSSNRALRERLRSGELNTRDYYRQVLRMVYRLIVLFVAEDREVLFHPQADEDCPSSLYRLLLHRAPASPGRAAHRHAPLRSLPGTLVGHG